MQVDTVRAKKKATNFATNLAVECCATRGTNGYVKVEKDPYCNRLTASS